MCLENSNCDFWRLLAWLDTITSFLYTPPTAHLSEHRKWGTVRTLYLCFFLSTQSKDISNIKDYRPISFEPCQVHLEALMLGFLNFLKNEGSISTQNI